MTRKKDKQKGILVDKVTNGLAEKEWETAYAHLRIKHDNQIKQFTNAILFIEETLLKVKKLLNH